MGDVSYTEPATLLDTHVLDDFTSAQAALDEWLKRRARKSHASGGARVFVVATEDKKVVGYYAIAAGAVKREVAPGRISRNMPEPIPSVVLGRLAVHRDHEGRGIGRGMLRDAILRSQRLSDEIGIRVLLCHAIDAKARAFYIHHGFLGSPMEAMTVMFPLR
jgi:GNAT superfamily N-acetyltransferase